MLLQNSRGSSLLVPVSLSHTPDVGAQRLQERQGLKSYDSESSKKSHYEQLVENQIKNPIVKHSFDPIRGRFGKENANKNLGAKPSARRPGKAKVIVKSTLFPVNV